MSEECAEADFAEADGIEARVEETGAFDQAENYETLAEDNEGVCRDSSKDRSEDFKEDGDIEHKSSIDYKENKEETYKGKVVGNEKALSKTGNSNVIDISNLVGEYKETPLEEVLDKGLIEIIEELIDGEHFSWKELWYIAKGFTRTGGEDVYKKIDRVAKHRSPMVVLMPGFASFPPDGGDFEEHSGYNTVRIPRLGAEETHKILDYIMQKTGMGAIVFAYSDGEKDLRKCLQKFGDEGLISAVYCAGADKGYIEKLMNPSRVFYINGAQDHLAIAWDSVLGRLHKGYGAHTDRPIFTIDGATHAGLVYDRNAIRKISQIIGETTKAKFPDYSIKAA